MCSVKKTLKGVEENTEETDMTAEDVLDRNGEERL